MHSLKTAFSLKSRDEAQYMKPLVLVWEKQDLGTKIMEKQKFKTTLQKTTQSDTSLVQCQAQNKQQMACRFETLMAQRAIGQDRWHHDASRQASMTER